MANLQIKGVDDQLYHELKRLAASENRSISQQVIFLVRSYLARRPAMEKSKTPAQTLLDLSGSWEDPRSAGQIVEEMRRARKFTSRSNGGI